MQFFKFRYLQNKRTYIYFLALCAIIIVTGIIYYILNETSIKNNIASIEKLRKVNLYYTISKNDTLNFITVVGSYNLKDSLLSVAKKESEGDVVDGINFTSFKVHKDSSFYFLAVTSDSSISEVASINKAKNKILRYYVYTKSIHFQ